LGAVGGAVFGLGFGVGLLFEALLTLMTLVTAAIPWQSILIGAVVGVIVTVASAAIPALSSMTTSLVSSCDSWAASFTSQSAVSQEWTSWTN